MPTKKDFRLLKRIFEEELFKIQSDHDVEIELSGFDSDVKTVFVIEKEQTQKSVTFDMLKDFENRIQLELGRKWQVGILYTDLAAWEAQKTANMRP